MATFHVIDTHTLVWFLGNDPRPGPNADAIRQDPTSELILPAIALAETCWIVQRAGPKVGRNDPCPCGSGKKYKKCCGSS